MSGLTLKIIRNIKKQKNKNHTEKKNVSAATNSELKQRRTKHYEETDIENI